MSPITARRYPDVSRRQCTPRAWSSWISHGATKRPPGNWRPQKGEPGKCRLSPGSRRAGPFVDRPLLCSSWNLPAPQNRVGQDARPEKQRGRRQQDGRTTALRNASPAARWRNRPHSSSHHHGGVLTHCHRHQDQHGQESGHSQKNCPIHPVLLLSTLSLKWPALVFSTGEGTHSVQNRNAKVSIILTIFNRIEKRRSPARARAGERGQKDSNLRAFYRLWFSRPAQSSALPCPLIRYCGVDYTISGQNIYGRGGTQCSCVVTGWKRHEVRDEKEVARTRQRANPSCGGFACSGRDDRLADEGGRQGGRTRSFRHLRSQPRRVVRGERPLPSSACLSARDREAEEVGSHDDLHPYSGHVHPNMRARAGRWLAGGIARSHLDAGVVRHRAQTSVDGRPRWLSVGIYLAMGWLAVIAAAAIFRAIPTGGIAWILGGGLVYSAGALIYGLKRPNLVPGIFGFHELWHLFVMAGSACHFWVMLRYIAPIS